VKIITTIGLSHTIEATNYYTFIVRKSCNAIFCVGQENDDLALFPSLSLSTSIFVQHRLILLFIWFCHHVKLDRVK
jgi:hypothetical protein